ncbi:sugar ABC transporter permease [Longimycelium tulufanense]|uniref:Sugar ABC transporter permease n=1 Tax=Longimycelium tulufanense TaxID=907463 RepID=A0A8J3CA74_9PSEU|nr:sugar ABC transporter permease [Longimycelium tulufanense]GGM38787.1 sugar ABC transporter permease [Longimycelium tulufanense]
MLTPSLPAPTATKPRQPPAPRTLTAGERWRLRAPLLPALVFAIALTQVPFLLTLYYSVQSQNLLRPGSKEFVGLANYGKVFTDELFRNAVFNTVTLTASTVILSMLLGIGLAVLLDKKFLGRSVVRTLLITPFLVMPAAAALLWKTSMFNPVFGLVNWMLSPFGVDNVDWASRYPMPAIVGVLVWQWTPFMMLIVLAGLQSQSPEVLEAAKVDGANAWQTFRRVTLPHLRQFIELAILLGSIFIVQTFDAIFMITQGGPGQATTNLPYFIYQQAFRAFDVGEAAAAGVIVVVATITIAMVALRVISNLFTEESA